MRGTARERAVACGASAHTHPSANPNQGVQGRGARIRPGPSPAALAYVSNLHPQEENQRTMTCMATMAAMATPG